MNTQKAFELHFKKMDGCWEWKGMYYSTGYGNFRHRPSGKLNSLAHRTSYEIYIGPIPKDLCVCHHCDNKSCVNPDHLFLGTQKDNWNDSFNKGRNSPPPSLEGSRNGASKLTEKIILLIRNDKRPERQIAKDYGVSKSLIGPIKHRQIWRHI